MGENIMSVVYFGWSPLDFPELERALHVVLDEDERPFDEDGMGSTGDGDDRVLAVDYKRVLRSRIESWSRHFDLPEITPQQYVNLNATQSWSLRFSKNHFVPDVIARMKKNSSDHTVYRPRALERANNEVMRWLRSRPDDVDRVDPRSFEAIVAEVVRDRGWTVELTRSKHATGATTFWRSVPAPAGFPSPS
jgi:hypothetical protein